MKYDHLTPEEKMNLAKELFTSMRGRYILAQALHCGIQLLSAVEPPFKEEGNIADMKLMLDTLFAPYKPLFMEGGNDGKAKES